MVWDRLSSDLNDDQPNCLYSAGITTDASPFNFLNKFLKIYDHDMRPVRDAAGNDLGYEQDSSDMTYTLVLQTLPKIPGALGVGRGQIVIYHGNENKINDPTRIVAFTT
jgi:hypothetical protein